MNKILCFWFAVILVASSCGNTNKSNRVAVYYGDDDSVAEDISDTIIVPFTKKGNLKYIPVKVNGVDFDMIIDTGCSGMAISMAEAIYLWKQGKLSSNDFIGKTRSAIADGSVVENDVVVLREVVIGDKITVNNVEASVSSNMKAPLLLGNGVLDKVATMTIDNENKYLIFNRK